MSDESGFFNLSDLDNSSKIFWNIDLKLCAFILFVIVVILLTSSLTSLLGGYAEPFANEQFYSYRNNINYSHYASVPLTAVGDEQNITFGQATRLITSENDKLFYNLDVFANLYILGGNVFDDPNSGLVNQQYSVLVINPKIKDVVELGNLFKDNDGLYRLKYKTNIADRNLIEYNIVRIMYKAFDTNGKMLSYKPIIEGDLLRIP